MNEIAAVIVTYNRKELLAECIQALRRQKGAAFDIIVTDNASTDGTAEQLAEDAARGALTYLNTGENLGGAGGFQYAIRYAVQKGYRYLWMMDDDTIPTETALQELLLAAAGLPEGWGFLSSRAVWTDGSPCKMNEQKLLHGRALSSARGTVPCREATFVSLFLPAETVYEVGLPIKEFFIWGDDVEYTRRISSVRESYYVSGSVVVHKTANNYGSNIAKDDPERLARYRYAYRNEVFLARKEGPRRCAYQAAKVLYHLARVLLVSETAKGARMKTILSASREGLTFHPQIEYPEAGQ